MVEGLISDIANGCIALTKSDGDFSFMSNQEHLTDDDLSTSEPVPVIQHLSIVLSLDLKLLVGLENKIILHSPVTLPKNTFEKGNHTESRSHQSMNDIISKCLSEAGRFG